VVVGTRSRRADGLGKRVTSALFWGLYRLFVQSEIPRGGVDVFGCTREFRDRLVSLGERNTTLVGLIFWLGFRRAEVGYERRARQHGKSAWSIARRVRYLLDSTFAFSDLPVRLLTLVGALGMAASLALALVVVYARATGHIAVPGYSATVLVVMFFGGLNSFGLGLLGEYVWRTFENTKGRPSFVIAQQHAFERVANNEEELQES
jgi:polyisoprenyl-phosphate glycosyltransferase